MQEGNNCDKSSRYTGKCRCCSDWWLPCSMSAARLGRAGVALTTATRAGWPRRTVSQHGRSAQQRAASLQRDSGWCAGHCPARLARLNCCCRKVLEPMLAMPIVGVSSVGLEVFESWAGHIRALIISAQAGPISKFWAGLGSIRWRPRDGKPRPVRPNWLIG